MRLRARSRLHALHLLDSATSILQELFQVAVFRACFVQLLDNPLDLVLKFGILLREVQVDGPLLALLPSQRVRGGDPRALRADDGAEGIELVGVAAEGRVRSQHQLSRLAVADHGDGRGLNADRNLVTISDAPTRTATSTQEVYQRKVSSSHNGNICRCSAVFVLGKRVSLMAQQQQDPGRLMYPETLQCRISHCDVQGHDAEGIRRTCISPSSEQHLHGRQLFVARGEMQGRVVVCSEHPDIGLAHHQCLGELSVGGCRDMQSPQSVDRLDVGINVHLQEVVDDIGVPAHGSNVQRSEVTQLFVPIFDDVPLSTCDGGHGVRRAFPTRNMQGTHGAVSSSKELQQIVRQTHRILHRVQNHRSRQLQRPRLWQLRGFGAVPLGAVLHHAVLNVPLAAPAPAGMAVAAAAAAAAATSARPLLASLLPGPRRRAGAGRGVAVRFKPRCARRRGRGCRGPASA
mmetsp:Transcript_139495/g.446314  ORF Transcript_139495/g.446314 Transcript_139495/m.446314 type:complete len:460 (+) Transcript_139495:2295-3674(+)